MTRFRELLIAAVALAGLSGVSAQTQINLRTQSQDIDFSDAATTKPFKSGTTLPATCSVGAVFFRTDAPAGSNIYGCTATNTWTLESATNPGGGTTPFYLQVERPNGTTLNIGSDCTTQAPCNLGFGNQVYSFTTGGTASISAGTGTAYIYVSSAGQITVDHTMTVSCAGGCVTQPGVTTFPPDSIPLYTWAAVNGQWTATGKSDWRAWLSTKVVVAGAGVTTAEAGGQTTVAVNPAVVGLRVAVPATPTTTCTSGSWAADTSYYYICVSPDTWRRVGISPW